jgi:cytochrome c biogenesis protein
MKQIIFKTLADLRFAIILLLIIAISSIIGTIIEQDQPIEMYKSNYPLINPLFGFLSWDIILRFGFDHVYSTWWFICFIFILGISLLTCTFVQQLPALKIARRCQFLRTSKQFYKLKIIKTIEVNSLSNIFFKIQDNNYSIFHQKNIFYSYKGLIGKIAPVIVHLSLILILLGTIITALTGLKAQEIIPKTETVHIQNLLFNGPFSKIPDVSTRINDFWITYSNKNIINQYYSDISIINNFGTELQQKTIYVNQPAKFNGITYYQTDWNLLGLRVQVDNLNIFQYPLVSIVNKSNKLWVSWISTSQSLKEGFTILIMDLQGYCSIYNEFGVFLGNWELNEPFKINFPLILIDILSSTGLQIKVDPGIPFIYSGFSFLMLSTLLSYITYSQIWILEHSDQILVGGNTNRAKFDFELEFANMINE